MSSTMMRKLAGVLALSLLGCAADEADIEDGADDVFLSAEAKADAFGVEDWSPDGAAVLRLITSATQAKLDDEVGLSSRVAKEIVDARAKLAGGKFTDLEQLDDVKYVGLTVFHQLMTYAKDHHLFKTSLRVPLVVEDANAEMTKALQTFNTQAKAAGVTGFARYTFVDKSTDFDAKMESYNTRLQELAMKTNTTIDWEMLKYAYSYSDFKIGTQGICYIGDGDQVVDVMQGQAGVMVGEMYSIWGWRHKARKWMYDDGEEQLGDDFINYDTKSDDVLVIYTNDDDGTHIASDVIKPCAR